MDFPNEKQCLRQAGSTVLQQQLIDQLCGMEPRHGPFFLFPPYIFRGTEIFSVFEIVLVGLRPFVVGLNSFQ